MPTKEYLEAEDDTLVRLRLIAYNRRLVDARKVRGLTQSQVADLVGIRVAYVGFVETLKAVPSADVMQEFADLYKLPVEYLFPSSLMATVERGGFQRRVRELGEPELYKLDANQWRALLKEPPKPQAEREELVAQVADVLNTLTQREQRVIRLRFGLEGRRSRTLEEVGKEFNVTRERISQIEAKALRKLRHPNRSSKLRDYLE